MADIFDVIADSTRRDILHNLLSRHVAEGDHAGESSVSEIVAQLELSQPTVSKHLKVLREAGLVSVREEGQHRYYSLHYAPLEQVEDWLIPFLSSDFDDAIAQDAVVLLGADAAARAETIGRVLAEKTHRVKSVVHDISSGVTDGANKVVSAVRRKR